jgi:hypothetical protein
LTSRTGSEETDTQGGSRRNETEAERLDRNLSELLNELRVALPGVQVLFAFLLTVPFTQVWKDVTTFQRDVYFATLLCSAAASLLLIAPSAQHRVEFRQQDKARLVKTANRLAMLGLAFLALAITGVLLLITDRLFQLDAALAVSGVALVLFALIWYLLPLVRRLQT